MSSNALFPLSCCGHPPSFNGRNSFFDETYTRFDFLVGTFASAWTRPLKRGKKEEGGGNQALSLIKSNQIIYQFKSKKMKSGFHQAILVGRDDEGNVETLVWNAVGDPGGFITAVYQVYFISILFHSF